MKNKNIELQQGFGIIAIIVVIMAVFGASAAVYYIQNNQSVIEPMVEQEREERAQAAQESGYPAVWAEEGLPEYPNGELRKVRDMGHVTLNTSDSPQVVKTFFDTEMSARGFADKIMGKTDLVAFVFYTKGSKKLTMQATVQKDTGLTKVLLMYTK